MSKLENTARLVKRGLLDDHLGVHGATARMYLVIRSRRRTDVMVCRLLLSTSTRLKCIALAAYRNHELRARLPQCK